MIALRIAAAALAIVLAAVALQQLVVQPFQCNQVVKWVGMQTDTLSDLPRTPTVAIAARRNISDVRSCTPFLCNMVDINMLIAANARILGLSADAIDAYSDALQWDRRPELFFNRGLAQFENHNHDAALHDLVTASQFNIYLIEEIPQPDLREEVRAIVTQLRAGTPNAR